MTEVNHTNNDELKVTVVSRRIACENSKFFVYFDHVIDKTGNEVKNYLVVSPKNTGKNLVTGVAILPIIDDQIALIRIYRPAIQDFSWEIPHGFVDEGETENISAERELIEETGLSTELNFIVSMGFITPDAGVLAARIHIFCAEFCSITQQIQGELGLNVFRMFSIPEFERMIVLSEIQDTITITAWCKYQLLLRSRQQVNLGHE